jgi:hypothetical protein
MTTYQLTTINTATLTRRGATSPERITAMNGLTITCADTNTIRDAIRTAWHGTAAEAAAHTTKYGALPVALGCIGYDQYLVRIGTVEIGEISPL